MKNSPKDKAREAILSYLTGVPSATRTETLDGAMGTLCPAGNLEAMKRSNRYATRRSYLGAVLSDLVNTGEVVRAGRGFMKARSTEVTFLRTDVQRKLRKALATRPYTRGALLHSMHRLIGTEQTSTREDDRRLEATVDEILGELLHSGQITLDGGKYLWRAQATLEGEPMDLDAFRFHFFDYLSERGGYAFELYVTGLLEKYYLMRGTEVLVAQTTGGSDDGGIDVEIHTRDPLGFVDRVLMQTKCRIKNHVTEKEVREFYGAMCAKHGSRGIYVTTSTFHPAAQMFLNSIDRIVGIDGEMLFSMALSTSYGIRKNKAGYRIDHSIFEL